MAPGLFAQEPVFPYGAVYFRKSNPPEEDWARDHAAAAKAGMNIFRHWVMWSAVEVAPGKYDWRDYDRMMDLEAQNGIKTIPAEMITAAPEWMFKTYPQARFEAQDGFKGIPEYSGSGATGGFPGLCLDNPEVRTRAEVFLKALASRYRNHPVMYGYDLWNEGNTNGGGSYCTQTSSSAYIPNEHRGSGVGRIYCYCPASQAEFARGCATSTAAWRRWRRPGADTASPSGTTSRRPARAAPTPTGWTGLNSGLPRRNKRSGPSGQASHV